MIFSLVVNVEPPWSQDGSWSGVRGILKFHPKLTLIAFLKKLVQ